MARVTISELMPSPRVAAALTSPTTAPITRPTTMPRARLWVGFRMIITTTPTTACSDPTDRSTSPEIISMVMAYAEMAVIDTTLSSTPMLRPVMKTGDLKREEDADGDDNEQQDAFLRHHQPSSSSLQDARARSRGRARGSV